MDKRSTVKFEANRTHIITCYVEIQKTMANDKTLFWGKWGCPTSLNITNRSSWPDLPTSWFTSGTDHRRHIIYFSPCVMHNGDRYGSPKRNGLVSCGHWMMPMLWCGSRADKISNKLAGDIACLGGSMVEHQPRLLGSRIRFPAGTFAIFSVSVPKLHYQFPIPFLLSLSPFPFSIPFLFLSLSLSLRSFICAKKRILRIYPNREHLQLFTAINGRVPTWPQPSPSRWIRRL